MKFFFFKYFQKKLSKLKIKLPEFPKSSSILQFKSEKKLTFRKVELQIYLQELLGIPEIESIQEVRRFLEMT